MNKEKLKPILIIAMATISILIIVGFNMFNKALWDADYIAFDIHYIDGERVYSEYVPGDTYHVNPYKGFITKHFASGKEESYDINIKKQNVNWKDNDGNSFVGLLYSDHSIIINVNEASDYQLRLIRTADFEDWKAAWDGEYELYVQPEGSTQTTPEEYIGASINLQDSYLTMTLKDGSKIEGNVYFCGPKNLLVFVGIDDMPIVQFNKTENGSIQVLDSITEDTIARFSKVE